MPREKQLCLAGHEKTKAQSHEKGVCSAAGHFLENSGKERVTVPSAGMCHAEGFDVMGVYAPEKNRGLF